MGPEQTEKPFAMITKRAKTFVHVHVIVQTIK